MCTYTTLQHNKHGYVARCRNCSQMKVAFANILLSFTDEQYYKFVNHVNELCLLHSDDPFMDRKSVLIPTAAKGVTMVYSPNELLTLQQLLKAATSRLKYEELLVFNKN